MVFSVYHPFPMLFHGLSDYHTLFMGFPWFSHILSWFIINFHQFRPDFSSKIPCAIVSHQVLDTWHESVRRGKAAAKGRRGSGVVGVSCEFPDVSGGIVNL